MATMQRETLTPPEAARMWGVKPDKILSWIRSGRLPAANVNPGGARPRYKIQVSDLEELWESLLVRPPKRRPKRASPSTDGDYY